MFLTKKIYREFFIIGDAKMGFLFKNWFDYMNFFFCENTPCEAVIDEGVVYKDGEVVNIPKPEIIKKEEKPATPLRKTWKPKNEKETVFWNLYGGIIDPNTERGKKVFDEWIGLLKAEKTWGRGKNN